MNVGTVLAIIIGLCLVSGVATQGREEIIYISPALLQQIIREAKEVS